VDFERSLFVGLLVAYCIWSIYMATFKTEEYNRLLENDWRRKKSMFGGMSKICGFGWNIFKGRKW